MGTESLLCYQAIMSPVVCKSKPSLAYQLKPNHFLSWTRREVKEHCGNYLFLYFTMTKCCFVSFWLEEKAEVLGSDFKLPAPWEIATLEINFFAVLGLGLNMTLGLMFAFSSCVILAPKSQI